MTAIYDAYKPLRNQLVHCKLDDTLLDIWKLATDSIKRIESHGFNSQLDGVMPWELPSLAAEVLLHAQLSGSKRLSLPNEISKAVQRMREVGNEASKLRLADGGGIDSEILRLQHQQFPWQNGGIARSLIRNLKVFGSPEVSPILEQGTGLTTREYFFLGFALSGHLRSRFDINSEQDYGAFGIDRERAITFFGRVTADLSTIRDELKAHHKVDSTWEHGWNPLFATPLVSIYPSFPNRLFCPVPELLLMRFSTGLYYDLHKVSTFGNAFGRAFERYIGEVLHVAFPEPFQIRQETPYFVKRQKHDGPDWVVMDEDGMLVIDCKTKRLTQSGRLDGKDGEAVRKDVGTLADGVVQNYRNILEALEGKAGWTPPSVPITPLIVTYEDWFFFDKLLHELLRDGVRERLVAKGMDLALLETMPYALMSARELEVCAGAIRAVGLNRFFSGKRQGKYPGWLWQDYSRESYPTAPRIDWNLAFKSDWHAVLPEAWRYAT